jgi:hypothetical protein
MRDLPEGPKLLSLARAVLLDELLPLLPAARRIDALLVANCLAIAEREAMLGAAPAAAAREVAKLYRAESVSSSAEAGAAPPADCHAAAKPESDAPPALLGDQSELWRRFARDLRRGAFEHAGSAERRARAILWRLTIAKLRLANPQFVDANRLAEPGGVGD